MQTFLPYSDFNHSTQVLDNKRLGKQRVEAKQIWTALDDPTYGWQNHPAVHMWRGCEQALALYGYIVCREWLSRGFKDTLLPWFEERKPKPGSYVWLPPWLGLQVFHRSHRSNLVRKDPNHYGKFWPKVPNDLPYFWPTKEEWEIP